MSKKKEFKVFKKKQPFFNFIKIFLRMYYRRPRVVVIPDKVEEKAIFVSNHCSKQGPMILEVYLPYFHAKWGAHEMLGNYKTRFHYLRDVYYIQKKKAGKFSSTLKAGFEAFFSIYFYKGMKIIGTYQSAQLLTTINNSIKVIENNIPVMIFPENSNDGYEDVIGEFFSGFVLLAERYYKKNQVDLPIYPMYFHEKKRLVVMGEPCYVQEYKKQGLDKDQISDEFRKKVNDLYFQIEAGKFDLPKKK